MAGLLGAATIDWSDQVVVITGGAGGVGRVLAEILAVLRATVVVLDVKEYVSDWGESSLVFSDSWN